MRKAYKIVAALAAGIMALGMGACGGSNGSSKAAGTDKKANDNVQCQNKVKKTGVEKVTVWAWYPAIEKIVDNFNETHNDVQACWVNAGQGLPEYTKFQNAIKAKKGAPDIIQLEYEAMPQFVSGAEKHLVDLGQYGMNKYKSDYTKGAWNSVSMGTSKSVYGVPVDLGPFVMFVRQDVFDKYNVKVPTTWAEFAQAGRQLKAAGYDGYLSDWAPNGTGVNPALFAQKNERIYKYSASKPDKVKVDLNGKGVKEVMDYWKGLVKEGLVDTTDATTTDWNTNMMGGKYAAYVQASWQTGYIKGLSKGDNGKFRIYKAPVWDSSTPMVNQGGSAWAVTDQAKDTAAAAKVARELFASDAAQKIGVTDGGLFPSWTKELNSDFFKNMQEPFLGGQKLNDINIPTAEGWKGYDFLPFQTYAYDEQIKSFTKIVKDGADTSSTLSALTTKLNDYAKQQGFTIE
ncbi:extracellular solute-binding protein [Bifidobacterium sp. ESL0690]|uniref:ABC transporter substrate-binding protein n=1 Tax=Bifidobacterium sp. ESL0690 TaxID=2983214 RepID=UPI0023F9EF36|nr:extracellular solute-binding protein [Bifidobacterium sp. ESL0690]WEV46918.1 extracellular solute-binding protein [Bifidobacterium sp. ESL0690]